MRGRRDVERRFVFYLVASLFYEILFLSVSRGSPWQGMVMIGEEQGTWDIKSTNGEDVGRARSE